MPPSEQTRELLELIRALVDAIHDGAIDAADGVELCRGASELLLSLRSVLPKWWMRAAVQAGANALLEASIYLQDLERQNQKVKRRGAFVDNDDEIPF